MKRIIIFTAVVLALVTGLIVFVLLPMSAQGQMKSVLKSAGFTTTQITTSEKIPGGYNYGGIRLDPNEFSTIENATLLSGADGKTLTLNKVVLTGDWRNGVVPEISGWLSGSHLQALAAALHKYKITTLSLNSGQLDIAVPVAGLLRLEAKGQVDLMPDGALRLQAVLWSTQKQLKSEIHINGEFARNGIASIDFEIVDGRVDLAFLEASRLGGWLILNKTAETAPWSISAQIVAGAARLNGLSVNGLTLSTQGNMQDATIAIQAGGRENDPMALAVDANLRKNGKEKVTATLRANSLPALITALSNTKKDQRTDRVEHLPGVVGIYSAEADTFPKLFDSAGFGISDLAGKVWMKGILRKTATGADLDLQQVSILSLAQALGLNDFNANGMLTGLFPITKDDQDVWRVDQGLMRATQPAKLSFSGDSLPSALKATRKDAIGLIKSFNYDNLEIFISGPLSGQLEGDITMTGKSDSAPDAKSTLVTLRFKDSLSVP